MRKLLVILLITCSYHLLAQTAPYIPELKEEYLGQKPPGTVPEVFAPGIVSDTSWAEHCQLAVSPNGDEIFWSAWSGKYRTKDGEKNTEQIYYSKISDGKWSEPQLAPFIKNNMHGLNGGPVFSLDGKRLYFYQVQDPWMTSGKYVYYVEKKNSEWSTTPIRVSNLYNTHNSTWTPFFTKKGNAYTFGESMVSIIKYRYENNEFSDPDSTILPQGFRMYFNVYVSPNEEYLIFSGVSSDSYGDLDLYICYKDNKGGWGHPINMGPKINTDKRERFPIVSPDGKYFFFMRHTETQDFFWVSTDIFKELN